jgi:hypothetical protein
LKVGSFSASAGSGTFSGRRLLRSAQLASAAAGGAARAAAMRVDMRFWTVNTAILHQFGLSSTQHRIFVFQYLSCNRALSFSPYYSERNAPLDGEPLPFTGASSIAS